MPAGRATGSDAVEAFLDASARGLVDLPDAAVLAVRRDDLVDLVRRWVRA